MTSVYEAVTFSKQEKCQEKDMNYQDIWYNYSVIVMNIFLVSTIYYTLNNNQLGRCSLS